MTSLFIFFKYLILVHEVSRALCSPDQAVVKRLQHDFCEYDVEEKSRKIIALTETWTDYYGLHIAEKNKG